MPKRFFKAVTKSGAIVIRASGTTSYSYAVVRYPDSERSSHTWVDRLDLAKKHAKAKAWEGEGGEICDVVEITGTEYEALRIQPFEQKFDGSGPLYTIVVRDESGEWVSTLWSNGSLRYMQEEAGLYGRDNGVDAEDLLIITTGRADEQVQAGIAQLNVIENSKADVRVSAPPPKPHFETVATGPEVVEKMTREAWLAVEAVARDAVGPFRLGTTELLRTAEEDFKAGRDTSAAEDFRQVKSMLNIALQRILPGARIDVTMSAGPVHAKDRDNA